MFSSPLGVLGTCLRPCRGERLVVCLLQAINIAYVIVASLCTFIGGVGYYMYGNNVADVIAFNLPKGILATLCISVVLVNPIAKFALTMEPPGAAAELAANGGVPAKGFKRAAIRTGVALGCLLTARC